MNPFSENIEPVDVELGDLIALFYDDPVELGVFSDVVADDMPQPYRDLLAHNHHMTVTVERHHDSAVDVQVLDTMTAGDCYARKILLNRQSDGGVVQFGIVRLHFEFFSPEVRREIEGQGKPLGRILIQHDVMRQVRLLNLYRVNAGPALATAMGFEPGVECFGRTAIIFCNGAPAIELLEIVGNC